MDGQIDMVYLWVDGNDPALKKSKVEAMKKFNIGGGEYGTHECRFFDNEELKYSLRSLEKFAPWIQNIYIVTNNQIPKWLNLSNPRIRIIYQNEILPLDARPCFNSNALEHCIVNIPHLSEYFLYGNDDFFFGDYVEPSFFFRDSKPIYRFDNILRKDANGPYTRFLKNADKLVFNKYKTCVNRYPHHNIEPYTKEILKNCYDEFKEAIDNTIYSHFRDDTDIQKMIYGVYAIATGMGVFKYNSKIDVDLPWHKRMFIYCTFHYQKDSVCVSANNPRILRKLRKYKPRLFCINDDEGTNDNHRKKVREVLDYLFPQKSQFEK